MKTSWDKPMHIISFIRTLLIVLAVAVCTVAAEDLEALRKKAEAGDADAQHELAIIYGRGEGVPKDVSEYLKWYGKTIEQGDAEAQFNLGMMYGTDSAESVKWFRKAAEQGYAAAQNYLGAMYAQGMDVPKDDAESFKWFRMAAEQGDASAQTMLGAMYFEGMGVPEDDDEAVKWYRKAAEQGYFLGQGSLGRMYDLGRGVPEDDVAAYAWYSLAAAKFRSWTADRDRIQRELSPAQIDRGEMMAREISERIEKRKAAKARARRDSDALAKKAQAPSKKTQAPTIRFGKGERYVSNKHKFSVYFPGKIKPMPIGDDDPPYGPGTYLGYRWFRGDSSISYTVVVMRAIRDEPPIRDHDVLKKMAMREVKNIAQDGRIFSHRVVRFQNRYDAVYLKYPYRAYDKDFIKQSYEFFTDDGSGRFFKLSIHYTRDLEQQATDRLNKFVKRFNYKP
jgi:TPR repeat protein